MAEYSWNSGKKGVISYTLWWLKKTGGISHSRSFTLWGFCHCFLVRPLRKGQASLWRQILLNLAENMDLYLWVWGGGEKKKRRGDTLRSNNVIMAIARCIVLVCKAVVQRPIIDQHSIPDFSNDFSKQSFQNEFLNQCIEAGGKKNNNKKKQGAGGFWSSTPWL